MAPTMPVCCSALIFQTFDTATYSRKVGFTVLPMHAVGAFGKPELVNTHELPNPVSETLYLATRRDRTMPNRMDTIITEAMKWI